MRWLVTAAAAAVVVVDMGEDVEDVVAAEVIIPDNQTLFTAVLILTVSQEAILVPTRHRFVIAGGRLLSLLCFSVQ
jgi:hypothetical protein